MEKENYLCSGYLRYRPVESSYRVSDNIWAGAYPHDPAIMEEFGITDILNLTMEDIGPYKKKPEEAIRYHHLPIADGGKPDNVNDVVDVFLTIRKELYQNKGRRLYIHCNGGIGRTGTIVSCWYIFNEKLSAAEALKKMRERFNTRKDVIRDAVPENKIQVEFINEFEKKFMDYLNIITPLLTKASEV